MQVTEALQNLGLSEKESRVYVALLQLGRSSAYGVAEKSGLKRPTTYVILGELIKKGLALKIPRSKKKLFAPKHPEEFMGEAEERLQIAKSVLPELLAMADKRGPQLKTLYYEGMRGLSEMQKTMNKRMRGKEIVGFYARIISEERGQELEKELFKPMQEEREKNEIKVRGLAPDDSSLQWYKQNAERFGYSIHWLDSNEYLPETSMEIGDSFVQLTSHRYLQGIHIENPDIANSMRQIFEMVWKRKKEQS